MERAMDKIKGSWDQVKGDVLEHYVALSVCDVLHVEDELRARLQLNRSKVMDEVEDIIGRLASADAGYPTRKSGIVLG